MKMYYNYEVNIYVLVKADSENEAKGILDKTVESVDNEITVLNYDIDYIGERS